MASKLSAILLAAGKSRRMGRSKPLLPLGNRPLVRHCLDALIGGGIDDIHMVVGTCGDTVVEATLDLPVTVVRNHDPEGDMAGSVRCALKAIPEDCEGVLVALVDHPLVRAETIASLRRQHERHPRKIIVPTCRGRQGHPTLFPRAVLEELQRLPTLRHIVHLQPDRILHVPVEDHGTLLDLDTPEEYRRAVNLVREETAVSSGRTGIC